MQRKLPEMPTLVLYELGAKFGAPIRAVSAFLLFSIVFGRGLTDIHAGEQYAGLLHIKTHCRVRSGQWPNADAIFGQIGHAESGPEASRHSSPRLYNLPHGASG